MNNDHPKMFVHIGSDKAGSSAIQAFLNYNRKTLYNLHGVLYPNLSGRSLYSGVMHNHSKIFFELKEKKGFKERIHLLRKCKKICDANKTEKIVFSSEALFKNLGPEVVREVVDYIGCRSQIILYLRRQDYWIESAWKQWGHKDKQYSSIQEFAGIINADWFASINNWLEFFSPEDFIIVPFERSSIGDDIVLNFLRIIGIEGKDGFVDPPSTNINVNKGFTPDIIEILSLCKDHVRGVHDNRLMDFFSEALSDRYKKQDPFKPYGLLSPTERLDIIKKYESSNRDLASQFLSGKRDALFLEHLPDIDEPWQDANKLTLEKVIPVFMELILHQQEQIQRLKHERKSFPRFIFDKLRGFNNKLR